MYAKFSKFKFLLVSISFLSYMMTRKGIMVDLAKVAAVCYWTKPTSPTEIQSFVGLKGYYRCFVKGFSSIAAILNKLTQKKISCGSMHVRRAIKTQGFMDFSSYLNFTKGQHRFY